MAAMVAYLQFLEVPLAMVAAVVVALAGGTIVYGTLKTLVGIRLDPEEEFEGADLTIHKITATPDRETHW